MRPSLQLKIGQHLTMTPQLQQAIKLLQLSTLDLQQEIQEALESNPMLEMEEQFDSANSTPEYASTEQDKADYTRQLEIAAESGTDNGTDFNAKDNYTNSKESDSAGGNTSDNDNVGDGDVYGDGDSFSADNSEWSDSIPSDLPVDTSWDDIYQSSTSGSSSNYDNEDGDFEVILVPLKRNKLFTAMR